MDTLNPEERRGVGGGVQQLIVDGLDRVDRCTTCHLAIERPTVALGVEPFRAHPGRYLEWHPPAAFGCTVCHGGQGLATDAAAAHGDVRHWEEPLLRGPLVQASCASCHGDLEAIAEHVPLLLQGQRLFEAKGCYGCHAIDEFGGTISQDLTEVGSKPYELIAADFEMMPPPHNRITWLRRKLHHPRTLNPGLGTDELPPGEEEVFPSAMPNFGLDQAETEALSVYVLSLRELDPPASYAIPAPPTARPSYESQVAWGRAVFSRFGCAGCHGPDGTGGRHNWNAGLGFEVPPLLYVKAYFDEASLKQLIRDGRQPAYPASADRPIPPLYMPPWKDRLTEPELNALVAYLFSLHEKVFQPAAREAATTAAD